ncbi:MAG TPA: hypothetical protein VHD32_08540 [Candidatus Didemnitutus sp.]|nr:hypothetical protein [Candidatus Didemnitutus sp.]
MIAASALSVRATIVGLNQIVTPEIQPPGILGLSFQAEHRLIGNSQQYQAELGLTPQFEMAWFQGVKPGEGLFSTEYNLWAQGPHLLSLGLLNWSTRGGSPQPVVEYGWYSSSDKLIAGGIHANREAEALLGWKHVLNDNLALSFDFQSGRVNSVTGGVTYNFTPDISINPAIYRTNGHPHHLLGYVVITWNLKVWK